MTKASTKKTNSKGATTKKVASTAKKGVKATTTTTKAEVAPEEVIAPVIEATPEATATNETPNADAKPTTDVEGTATENAELGDAETQAKTSEAIEGPTPDADETAPEKGPEEVAEVAPETVAPELVEKTVKAKANTPKAGQYIVTKQFKDAPQYRTDGEEPKVYAIGTDVSHFPEKRLKDVLQKGFAKDTKNA